MQDPINPPGHHRHENERAALVKQLKTLRSVLATNERQTLETALLIGENLVKLKASGLKHGEWLPLLKEIGVSQQRASEYMRLAKLPAPVICSANSVNEALAKSAPDCGEADEPALEREPGCDEPEEEEEAPTIAADGSCVPGVLYCRPCRTSNRPKPGCKDCIKKRQAEEDGEEEAPKPKTTVKAGAPAFSMKDFVASLGRAVAELNKLAILGGHKREGRNGQADSVIETPEMKEIRAKLEEARALAEAFLKKLKGG